MIITATVIDGASEGGEEDKKVKRTHVKTEKCKSLKKKHLTGFHLETQYRPEKQ